MAPRICDGKEPAGRRRYEKRAARDVSIERRFLRVRIGGVVGIFQRDVVGGLVFGDDFAGFFGLGFEDEDFDVVGAFGIFGDGERVGGNRAWRLDAFTLQQAA